MFYWTFGWLTRLLPLPAVAWVGRLLTWALLAYAWRRLSWAVLPQAWLAVLGAVLFVSLNENAHMAGEWIVGGAEAKGFAYVLVLLGIEAVVRARWNLAWLLLGAATGMHAVVGGWSLVTAGVAWLADRSSGCHAHCPEWACTEHAATERTCPRKAVGMAPECNIESHAPRGWSEWISVGALLPGRLVLASALTRGRRSADRCRCWQNAIYVWQRLPHHLAADRFQIGFPSRHMLLWALWLVLITISPADGPQRRLRWMVNGAMLLTAIGFGFVVIGHWNPTFAASLLRFYWFRMSDVFVPLGVTLVGLDWLRRIWITNSGSPHAETRRRRTDRREPNTEAVNHHPCGPRPLPSPLVGEGPGVRGRRAGRLWLAGLIIVAVVDLGLQFEHLPPELACCGIAPVTPRADKGVVYDDWRDVCRWAGANTDSQARFLTPRMAMTFRWNADRGEVVTWKDIPQNADGIVEWWRRLGEIWGVGSPAGPIDSLALLGQQRLAELAGKYQAEYAIVQLLPNEARLPIKPVFENTSYAVYRFSSGMK